MKTERGAEAGSPVVEGIAIGRAVIWEGHLEPRSAPGTPKEEEERVARALFRANRGIEELVRLLPPAEAELFEPEMAILAELGPLLTRLVKDGASGEEAINRATSRVSTDLLLDARARLLDGLGHGPRSVESLLEGRDGDRVLVTESLTPSLVASLPARVVGIIATSDGAAKRAGEYTSHSVIIARGRGIPLAFFPSNVVRGVADDAPVILDTMERVASMWMAPDESVLAEAQRRHRAWILGSAEDDARVANAPLSHLGLEVHVNVGSIYERVPESAEGIGLLRTELVFSGHARAPSEVQQFGALRAIAAAVGSAPVVVRLFDAGADKPLAWLKVPEGSPDARGVALLFMHRELLDTQLRAIVRAAEHVNVRVLLPVVRSGGDVEEIRELSRGKVAVGAMIETPAAVERSDEVAAAADFICIGTNDLFAMVTGQDRANSSLSLDASGLRMIERVIAVAHARGRRVSVCGEIAADPQGARILVGLGVDGISVATARFAKVKLSLRDVTLEDCRRLAREALR